MTTEFDYLGLHPQIVQAVAERGYTDPTPIQSEVIPLLLAGTDVIGQAQTGTGKTAAFALPIIDSLPEDRDHIHSLVVAPTRELAMQVARAFHEYGHYSQISVLAIYGGQAYGKQIGRLRRGVDVVVGTPGRLLDLINRNEVDLSRVHTVVLDEADEMLSMGFIEDVEAILSATPETRQTALFSATLPQPIRRLADQYMRSPVSVTIEREQVAVDTIEQRYYLLNEQDKVAGLTRLFESETITRAIVFARTRVATGELANELAQRGYSAETLNGDLSQDARNRVLDRFRNDQVTVLVATDVAARGLDIDDVSHVINFDLPNDPEVYVHRIGRTGRAGKTGIAISLITTKEQWRLRRIEKYIRSQITRTEMPTVEDIMAQREAQLVENMLIWLRRGRCRREREIVDSLIVDGHDPLEIAAAALKLARVEEKQRPIERLSPVEEQRQSRDRHGSRRNERRDRHSHGRRSDARHNTSKSHEQGMVRMTLSAGREQGVRPADVVGTIAYHADIPGRALGAIRIQDQYTLVDVPEQYVAQVLDKDGNYRIGRQKVAVEVAS
ncbi:MAG: DEAD/DEAH box helicase [Anaerolineae bacterium]|nr:DEAD/DEAH box helicase [Anaerolineae bacterium]MCO5194438.1 DEAD/DEAH box helicase [Anaerolineae bacterium]MCO5199343.1 DEAD/DEAH box helicase [Anaerolineae bacterium]